MYAQNKYWSKHASNRWDKHNRVDESSSESNTKQHEPKTVAKPLCGLFALDDNIINEITSTWVSYRFYVLFAGVTAI